MSSTLVMHDQIIDHELVGEVYRIIHNSFHVMAHLLKKICCILVMHITRQPYIKQFCQIPMQILCKIKYMIPFSK